MLLNVPQNSTAQKLPIGQLPVRGRKLSMQPASFPGATAPGTGNKNGPFRTYRKLTAVSMIVCLTVKFEATLGNVAVNN